MPPILYSTNVFLKFHFQERFRRDIHYVWCSENFDSKILHRYSAGSLVAPSSNPADIFKELKRDVDGKDQHSAKINEQKIAFKTRAVEWHSKAEITDDEKDDIFYTIDHCDFSFWRPLLYVIPRNLISPARLKLVPPDKRAGIGPEYIIEDLKRDEFDIIEMPV